MGEKFTAGDVVKALHETKGMVYVAARKLDCAPGTIYNYAKRYPSVQDAITAERGVMIDIAEIALWKAIQGGEGWAISLALKTIGKDRGYTERVETVNYNVDPALMQRFMDVLKTEGLEMSDVVTQFIAHAKRPDESVGRGDMDGTDAAEE